MPRIETGTNRDEARARIDAETSAAILAGFDYEVGGEIYHFSYDAFDQQNFADTANACLLAKSGARGLPESVTWNAYRAKGELVQLSFRADEFLVLYAGALWLTRLPAWSGAVSARRRWKRRDLCALRRQAASRAAVGYRKSTLPCKAYAVWKRV